jgi:hypothetical protein
MELYHHGLVICRTLYDRWFFTHLPVVCLTRRAEEQMNLVACKRHGGAEDLDCACRVFAVAFAPRWGRMLVFVAVALNKGQGDSSLSNGKEIYVRIDGIHAKQNTVLVTMAWRATIILSRNCSFPIAHRRMLT